MIQFIMKLYTYSPYLTLFKSSLFHLMIPTLSLHAPQAMSIALAYMILCTIRITITKKVTSTNNQVPIIVSLMIIKYPLLQTRLRKTKKICLNQICLLDALLKNIWSSTRTNAKILLLSFRLLTAMLLHCYCALFKEFY